MARESLMRLTSRVRTMISDNTQGSEVFTDDEVQDTLDQHRHDIWFTVLRPLPTFIAGQPIQYLNYVAEGSMGGIEDNYILQRADYTTIDQSQVSDFQPYPAKWVLTADSGEPSGIRGIAVRLTGYGYDLHYVAGDLLTMWAARVALEFDFTGEKSQFMRSQQHYQLLKLADYHYQQAQPTSSRLWQGDGMPDMGGGPGIVYPAMPSSGMPIP